MQAPALRFGGEPFRLFLGCTSTIAGTRMTIACSNAPVASGAKVVVTGDQHLLALHPYGGIAIVKPKRFLDWIEGIS